MTKKPGWNKRGSSGMDSTGVAKDCKNAPPRQNFSVGLGKVGSGQQHLRQRSAVAVAALERQLGRQDPALQMHGKVMG